MEETILKILEKNSYSVDDGYGDCYTVVDADDIVLAKDITSLFTAFTTWMAKGDHNYILDAGEWFEVPLIPFDYDDQKQTTLDEIFQYWLNNIHNK